MESPKVQKVSHWLSKKSKRIFSAIIHDIRSHKLCSKNEPMIHPLPSLKLTASLPLKMDGWNTSLSYWVSAYFQGRWLLVSGRIPPNPVTNPMRLEIFQRHKGEEGRIRTLWISRRRFSEVQNAKRRLTRHHTCLKPGT